MVKVIDEYKKGLGEAEEYNRMYESAQKFFPGRVREKCLDRVVSEILIETDTKEVSVKICPTFYMMYVKQASDLEKAKQFAEEEEKKTGREFTLRTTYPSS